MSTFKPTSERLLFGQYLLEKGIINKVQLVNALTTQQKEAISEKPRRLGMILLYDHNAFYSSRAELYKHLKAFELYKRDHKIYRPPAELIEVKGNE
jgi:hypothetical protein